jgi:hypothetical protein
MPKVKTFYELSEEEQDAILIASADPAESALGKDLIELNPSKVIDPDKPKPVTKTMIKDTAKTILKSPFMWTEDTGYIVPGENIEYLSDKLGKEQLVEVKEKAKNIVGNSNDGIISNSIRENIDIEIISTDSVDDRFDNI